MAALSAFCRLRGNQQKRGVRKEVAQAGSREEMAEVRKETCWEPRAVWGYWGTKGARAGREKRNGLYHMATPLSTSPGPTGQWAACSRVRKEPGFHLDPHDL